MNLPFDNEEYLSRQNRLFEELPPSTCLIIPTNDKKIRSNDVTYPFRPNSYMLYLCGWTGDEGVFIASNISGKLQIYVICTAQGHKIGNLGGKTTWSRRSKRLAGRQYPIYGKSRTYNQSDSQ